ncbi:hypothetical protein C2W64_04842 [Brevibacillus laterosporus]|nr:hypothetical protein [Brevibacillus laterosporus]RAP28408.1 hypothetical protein C2W64_04842 [Brevibacillus laterosporus]
MNTWAAFQENVLYPDCNARYYFYPFVVDPEVEIIIEGEYPCSRYMSYTVYGCNQQAIASAFDQMLIPNDGCVNTFDPHANWYASNRSYTLKLQFTPPPPFVCPFVPGVGNNTFFVGALPNGQPNPSGILVYRIYVASEGVEEAGGELPKVTYRRKKDGKRLRVKNPMPLDMGAILQQSNWICAMQPSQMTNPSITLTPTPNVLTWYRPTYKQNLILLGNPQGGYTYAPLCSSPAQYLCMRWRAPTFPATYHNQSITGLENMRYWSMSFVSTVGTATICTLADYQTVLDQQGCANLIVGFGAPRPAFATPERGYTWVDLGNQPVKGVIYRNMVVSACFPCTAANVPFGQQVTMQMGEYLPVGQYIPVS